MKFSDELAERGLDGICEGLLGFVTYDAADRENALADLGLAG